MAVTFRPVGLLKKEMKHWVNSEALIILKNCEDRTIQWVCEKNKFPVEVISLFVVDGYRVDKTYKLRPDDVVTLVALIGGG